MSLYANLECGRLDLAREVFDGYFTDFHRRQGHDQYARPGDRAVRPHALSCRPLLRLTGDRALLLKHRAKIEAIATMLAELQDEALALPASDRGYGLIHGWCESDSCLAPDPSVWWKPYYANSAFAVRGWREIAATWRKLNLPGGAAKAADWEHRADRLQGAAAEEHRRKHSEGDEPAVCAAAAGFAVYVSRGAGEGAAKRAAVAASLLRRAAAGQCASGGDGECGDRHHARLWRNDHRRGGQCGPSESERSRHSRVHLVWLCADAAATGSHRGVHPASSTRTVITTTTRGSWTAGEVSGITGGGAIFCIPAQQTIPLLVRWMLVFEDND